MYKFIDIFKDKHGQIVLAQTPNLPLIGWFIFMVLNLIWNSDQPKIHSLFSLLSFGFIFTWAWLEISDGVNYFRRALGLFVLIIVVCFRL